MERVVTDPVISQMMAGCSKSTRQTAKTFFPERFYMPFAEPVHGKIFDLIDGPSQKVCIAAPRGWGKTSIVALALMARYIMFHITGFICYINKSHDAAALQTENLRRELVTNRMIKTCFGDFRHRGVDKKEFDEVFSKKAWVAYDTLVWPRGAGQQVRGVLFKNDRPGLIVIDDLEDPEKIENDDIRKGWHQWLYADVIKAVPRLHKNWKIVYIDTLKHEDSTLQKLLDSPEWDSVRLEACDDNFRSAAPEFMSDKDIKKEYQEHVDAGLEDVFYRELRNLPISTRDAAFRPEYFKYYNLPPEKPLREEKDLKVTDAEIHASRDVETVVLLDPAKTVKIHSAESAIIGVGIDLKSARLYVRDAISEKMYPDEIYDALFEMGNRLGANALGIEETSLNEFIKQPIKAEMLRRQKFFELIWLKTRGGMKKELRVKELVPYYRLGYMYHNASCEVMTKLEAQLKMFPRSKLWDLMDCLAYIIEMLEMGQRYWAPGYEDPEDEFKELEKSYDAPVENWRVA